MLLNAISLPKDEQEEFGKGSVKGLAAPESANNAACTGSFVPLLTLGIPGSGTTAILLGALIALNVSPGPRLMQDQPDIFWSVIISMYIGNVVLLILNLPLIPYIAKGADGPAHLLDPVHPVLHPNGGLYRPKQRHGAFVPCGYGGRGNSSSLRVIPAGSASHRVHFGANARG